MNRPVLCTPLLVEYAALRPAARSMRMVRTGCGPRRAAAAAVDLKAMSDPGDPVLVAGVGGGLDPRVHPGDVVVADEIRGGGPPVGLPSAPLLAGALRRLGLTVHIGPVLSRTRIARTSGWPADPDGPLALDMESDRLAGAGGPFAVVRAVVDTTEHPLWRAGTPARGVRALRALRACVPALEQWAAATGPREILLAAPRSFCAGVARAIDTVQAALERYGAPVYVRRQIVHNAHVVRELQARGAVFVEETDEVPPGAVLVFAAHGVSPAVRRAAAERDLIVIDATCPLVTKVHTEIRRYAASGHTVFLIGHADHEEVQGSRGEAPSDVVVVEDVDAARRVRARDPERVAYTMQTTLAVDEAEQIADVLRDRFPFLSRPRTADICYATTNRQAAVRAVAREVDVVLAVGSPNSSNSHRLAEVAEREGAAADLVDDVGEIDLRCLAGARRVGVTAGASAPSLLVDQVVACLAGLGPVTTREVRFTDEDLSFALPKEVV